MKLKVESVAELGTSVLSRFSRGRKSIILTWVHALKQDFKVRIDRLKTKQITKRFAQVACIDFAD